MADTNNYKKLLRRSVEPCDFCNRIFKNKFESIIHNASHIIIPLIKQNYYQCDICLSTYNSQDQLDDHRKSKHLKSAIKSGTSIKSDCEVKFKNSDAEFDRDDKKIFKNVVDRLAESNFKDLRHCKSLMGNTENGSDFYVKEEYSRHKSIKIEIEDTCDDNGTENGDDTQTENVYGELCNDKVEPIKSRLRFEEDDDLFHNNSLSDFITECKVKMFNEPLKQMPGFRNHKSQNGITTVNNNQIPQIQNNNVVKLKNNTDACNDVSTDDYEYDNFLVRDGQNADKHNETIPTINGRIIDKFNGVPEPIYKSVHYTDLMKPGLFLCKYCCKTFPNRLSVIKHEPAHIKMKTPHPLLCTYCERYIAGNYVHLHRHINREHPGANVSKRHKTRKCKRCGLRFRKYMPHVRNYHPHDCPRCGKEYGITELADLNEHINNCVIHNVSSKTVNVCEMCYGFVKVKNNLKYILTGATVNEPGVRHPCAMCGKEFFELKTMKRILYGAKYNVRGYHKMRKPLSNEDRLKKFQHRLKKINSLNKFYSVILFAREKNILEFLFGSPTSSLKKEWEKKPLFFSFFFFILSHRENAKVYHRTAMSSKGGEGVINPNNLPKKKL